MWLNTCGVGRNPEPARGFSRMHHLLSARAPAIATVAGAAALLLLPGCALVEKFLGGAEKAVAAANGKLIAGDLPGAADAYAEAAKAHPGSVDAASGAAYTALLQGDAATADQLLAAAEAGAGERLGEVKLRRALVALEAGDLDAVRTHGEASGLGAGKLLAAEVALADGEREQAQAILEGIRGEPGVVGTAAGEYLSLIGDPEPLVAGLSEAQALWALGERKVAVRSVEELVKNLPDSRADREEQLLVWAGRAASVGETDVARSLLDAAIFPPEGQAWRKLATAAIVSCAEGDGAGCVAQLDALEGTAPSDGLADARATAAFLIADRDAEAARKLAGPYVSNASARALAEAGDKDAARASVPGGVYGAYLNGGGS